MSGGRRWDVFLAYASPDRDRARLLHRALVAAGLSVFFDEAGLRVGDNWHRELPEHLGSSAVVVVLVSLNTAEALFETAEVLRTLERVRRGEARMVPLLLDPGAKLPYGTEALQAMKYFGADRTDAVVAAIVDVVRDPSGDAARRLSGAEALSDRLAVATGEAVRERPAVSNQWASGNQNVQISGATGSPININFGNQRSNVPLEPAAEATRGFPCGACAYRRHPWYSPDATSCLNAYGRRPRVVAALC